MSDPGLVKPPAAVRGARGGTRGRGIRGTRAGSAGASPTGASVISGPPPGSPQPPAPAPRPRPTSVAPPPSRGLPSPVAVRPAVSLRKSSAPAVERAPIAARKSSAPSVERAPKASRVANAPVRPVSTYGKAGGRPAPPAAAARPMSTYGAAREDVATSGAPTRASGASAGRRKLASSMYEGIAVPNPAKGGAPFNMAALKKELQEKQKSESPRKGMEEAKKSEEGKKKNLFAFRKGKDKDKEKDKDKDKGGWQYKYQKEKKAREKAERLRSTAEDEKDRLVELVSYLYTTLATMADNNPTMEGLKASITDLHQQILAKDAELGLELKEEEAVLEVKPLPNSRMLPRPPAAGAKAAARAATTSARPGRTRLASSRRDSSNELKKINESRTNLRQLMNTTMQREAAAVAPKIIARAEPEKALTEEEKQQRQRENTVNELVSTESQFQFDCAEMIITNFMVPLKDVLSEEDLQAVFSNVEAIVPFSADLRRELTTIVAQPPEKQMIGELFLKRMEEFYVFTQYCVNQPLCSERVKFLLKKNSQFRSVVEQRQAKPACQGLKLEDFLIKPVQRVCKYPLLLRAIVRATDESHPDHANLTQAMQKMEGVLTGINATKANTENVQKIQEIEAKFDEVELQSESRTFLLEGSLKKAVFNAGVGEDHVTGRAMFLFNDLLLLAKYQGKKLHMVTVFPVEHCLVWDVAVKDKHAFQVMRTDKKQSIVCYCDTDKSKDKWMHNINTAISDSFGAW